jgi:hypothetical protein
MSPDIFVTPSALVIPYVQPCSLAYYSMYSIRLTGHSGPARHAEHDSIETLTKEVYVHLVISGSTD